MLTSCVLKDSIKTHDFGVEVEMANLAIHDIAPLVARKLKNAKIKVQASNGEQYKPSRIYNIIDDKERVWGVDTEPSIMNFDNRTGELVCPPLGYEDLEIFQEIINELKNAGAFGGKKCGIHVHLDGAAFASEQKGLHSPFNRLNANFLINQDVLYKALQVHKNRREDYAEKLEPGWVDSLISSDIASDDHACRGLQLHQRYNTLEFRLFNTPKCFSPQIMRAYIELVLALGVASKQNAQMPPILRQKQSPQKSMASFLSTIGLKGDEFSGTRKILTRGLSPERVTDEEVERYMSIHNKYKHGEVIRG